MIPLPSFHLFRGSFMGSWLFAFLMLVAGKSTAQIPSAELPDFLRQPPAHDLELTLNRWENQFGSLPQEAEELISENTYHRHRTLLEGELCLDQLLTPFVQRVLDRLLKNGADLPMAPQIALISSTQPNAYATPQGWVLVSIGLLAEVSSEGELAFVLAHEISHLQEEHWIKLYLKGQSTDRTNILNTDYSHAIEQEADSLGLIRYMKAGYEEEGAIQAVAQLIHAKEQAEVLSLAPLQLGSRWGEGEAVMNWRPEPQKVDFQNQLRQLRLMRQVHSLKWTNESLPSSDFEQISQRAKELVLRQHVLEQEYESVLFRAALSAQLDSEPLSDLAQKYVAQSLYSLGMYELQGSFWDVHIAPELVRGPRQLIHLWMETLTTDERLALAILHLQEAEKRDAGFSRARLDHLLREICQRYQSEIRSLSYLAQLSPAKTSSPLLLTLQKAMQQTQGKRRLAQAWEDRTFDEELSEGSMAAAQRSLSLYGFGLGLNKVVWVDPGYHKLDQRKGGVKLEAESQQAKLQFQQLIGDVNRKTFRLSLLVSTVEVHNYARLSLLHAWVREKESHGKLLLVPALQEEVKPLIEEWGTAYFVWCDTYSITQHRNGRLFILVAGVLFAPLLPYSLYYGLTPKHTTLLSTRVYNLQTGEAVLIYPRQMLQKDRKDVLQAALYDIIQQLHQDPRER